MRNFSLFGTTSANRPGDALHLKHMEDLKRMIEIARTLNSQLVRIMTPKKGNHPLG